MNSLKCKSWLDVSLALCTSLIPSFQHTSALSRESRWQFQKSSSGFPHPRHTPLCWPCRSVPSVTSCSPRQHSMRASTSSFSAPTGTELRFAFSRPWRSSLRCKRATPRAARNSSSGKAAVIINNHSSSQLREKSMCVMPELTNQPSMHR